MVAVMSWQLQFKMCLKVLRKVLFEQGPYCGNCIADSLLKPPQRERSNMTGEGPALELFPLSAYRDIQVKQKGMDTCAHRQTVTQTLTHKATH